MEDKVPCPRLYKEWRAEQRHSEFKILALKSGGSPPGFEAEHHNKYVGDTGQSICPSSASVSSCVKWRSYYTHLIGLLWGVSELIMHATLRTVPEVSACWMNVSTYDILHSHSLHWAEMQKGVSWRRFNSSEVNPQLTDAASQLDNGYCPLSNVAWYQMDGIGLVVNLVIIVTISYFMVAWIFELKSII